ncbi:interphotoreceptor matrix proteoglycan 2 [Morone saxatilis]|uniref:interphotoreceptor matrix proteoglycan 2 n=1 Tax=Morone saxatilis TaxID=34816 RepID=UPI0015E24D7A|nr:interphotoreceptor matrix proteoglycan 2 [Morone saxatilis]
MQLHVYLLLFIITTDKTLALSHHHCGGDVSLDQEPAGHINLTLPGLFTDTNRLNPMNLQSDETQPVSVCSWVIGIPLGRTVLLKVVWLESGSSISVRCVWNKQDQVLESGGTALLSGCDRNKATLSWTGAGHHSNGIQLSYYVQEDERNSSEDHTSPHSDQDSLRWSQTGTSFTSTAPVGQEVVRGTDGGRGRIYEGLEEWSSGPRSVSSPSSKDQGLPDPTSPLLGLAVAGRADRETLPLPEEEPNNRADASGAAHLADGPMAARERTHPYFQNTLSTDTLSHTANTETILTNKVPRTQMALKHATGSSSNTLLGTDLHTYIVTQTSKLPVTTQSHPTISSSSIPPLTSSPSDLPSWTTWESDTILNPRVRAVSGAPGEKLPHSWRSQRSTDRLNSDLTSAVTFDPLKSQTEPQPGDSSSAHTDTDPTASSSSSQDPSRAHSSTTHSKGLDTAAGTVEANSRHNDSFVSTASDVTSQTAAFESSDEFEITEIVHTSSTQSLTDSPQSTDSVTRSPLPYTSSSFTQTSKEETQSTATQSTAKQSTQRNFVDTYMTTDTISSSPDIKVDAWTSASGSSSTPRAALTLGDVIQNSSSTGTPADTETYTLIHDSLPTNSPTPVPHLSSSTSIHSSTPSNTLQTHTTFSGSSHFTHTSLPLPSTTTESAAHTPVIDHKTAPTLPSQTSTVKSSYTTHTPNHLPLPSSTNVPATHKQSHDYITTTHTSLLSPTIDREVKKEDESLQSFPSSTTTQTPTARPSQQPPLWTTPNPSQENHTPSVVTSVPTRSSTTSQRPKFYIVPDQPAAIRVESIKLLLQIIVEESRSAFTSDLEKDTAAWVEPYLQRAPGFSSLLGVWSSGHAVQSLVEFKTSGALQWLSMTGPTSLLERTGLAQAVRERRSIRSSKITNITLGGLQGDVCDWLLQCQAGYKCMSQPGTSNYSCSSVCHFDYCHHHGICTHHPGQLPVCHCLVGEDFWYMGQRCDVRMTRARLVGACLAILLIMVTVIGVLACVAVRRYRAILIQAKVDQTRSSYRRFNHFDELSGRFWLRSWAGSADSLDNPAFTRSDELLHLRALDRPCCYHDDTLSLASTCPSHGTRINTIYPHSSQYGLRGSEMSMGDGVLDSGKASDLSVCSWPVEPIQWTPFPLLQQLASHRTPTVRVSRPRSYCEGMELVDLGKSWTA